MFLVCTEQFGEQSAETPYDGAGDYDERGPCQNFGKRVLTASFTAMGTGGVNRIFFGIEGHGQLIVGFHLRAKEAAKKFSHGRIGQSFHERIILSFELIYG